MLLYISICGDVVYNINLRRRFLKTLYFKVNSQYNSIEIFRFSLLVLVTSDFKGSFRVSSNSSSVIRVEGLAVIVSVKTVRKVGDD